MHREMSTAWLFSVPCSRDEAETLTGDVPDLADIAPVPVFVATEPDAAQPDRWRLDVYFDGKPSRDVLRRITKLITSTRTRDLRATPVEDADWVTLSQAGFEPLVAGRFHVRTPDHGAPDASTNAGLIDFVIPAGLAFGTGQHATTAGCLRVLDAAKRRGARFRNVIDLGTGTGLLAFAAARLWPAAAVTATDIDPVAIAVVRENAALNRIRRLRLVVADGLVDRALVRAAPYDLVIANILAQPLIDMAGSIAAALAPGGTLVLAGLLDTQAPAVARAYRRQGLRLAEASGGEWLVLRLVAR